MELMYLMMLCTVAKISSAFASDEVVEVTITTNRQYIIECKSDDTPTWIIDIGWFNATFQSREGSVDIPSGIFHMRVDSSQGIHSLIIEMTLEFFSGMYMCISDNITKIVNLRVVYRPLSVNPNHIYGYHRYYTGSDVVLAEISTVPVNKTYRRQLSYTQFGNRSSQRSALTNNRIESVETGRSVIYILRNATIEDSGYYGHMVYNHSTAEVVTYEVAKVLVIEDRPPSNACCLTVQFVPTLIVILNVLNTLLNTLLDTIR